MTSTDDNFFDAIEVATSVKVMNSALRAPEDHLEVVPQVEEVTGDIIRNGSDSDTPAEVPSDESSPSDATPGPDAGSTALHR